MIDLLFNIGVPAAIGFAALIFIGIIFARLYRRATKETAFVRTGLGGQPLVDLVLAHQIPQLPELGRLFQACTAPGKV